MDLPPLGSSENANFEKGEFISRGMAILYQRKKSLIKSVQKWLNASMRTEKTVIWPKYTENANFEKVKNLPRGTADTYRLKKRLFKTVHK